MNAEQRDMIAKRLVLLAEDFAQEMGKALTVYPDIDQDVYRRLQDRELARHPDFQESLNQMLAGLAKRAKDGTESAGEGPVSA